MSENCSFNQENVNTICNKLVANLDSLEELRKKARKRITICWLVFIGIDAICAAFFYFVQQIDTLYIVIGLSILLIGYAVFCYIFCLPVSEFKKRFSTEVTEKIISAFLPEAVFEKEKHIPMAVYDRSLLFTTNWDRYSGQNLVTGKQDKTAIQFSNLHTEYKKITRTKNGTKTTWHTIFKGIFFTADSNKNFNSHTFVLPDSAERLLGGLGKWVQRNIANTSGELVYLENKTFEKKFVVYSNDPVEARYLLTPQMQERLLQLHKHFSGSFCLSFVDGKFNIAINRFDDLFEPRLKKSLKDPNTIKTYTEDIIELLRIVEILDLNTRIWGK